MKPLAHFVVGRGPRPVLLLHGFLGSGRNLSSLARRWSEQDPTLTIVVPDQLGHGDSADLREFAASNSGPELTLSSLAEANVQLLEHLGLARAMLVGHSLGGRVALVMATHKTPRVVLLDISPSPIMLSDGLDLVFQVAMGASEFMSSRGAMRDYFLRSGVSAALADWMLMNVRAATGGQTGVVWRIDRQAMAGLHDEANAKDLWREAERYRYETGSRRGALICFYGRRSRFVSESDRERLRAMQAEVIDLEAGHFVHVDAAQALLAHLCEL